MAGCMTTFSQVPETVFGNIRTPGTITTGQRPVFQTATTLAEIQATVIQDGLGSSIVTE